MARPKTMPVAMTCMLKTLNQEQGASMQEMVEETGLSKGTLSAYLKVFARHGLIHIQSWEQDTLNRFSIRRWKWGQAPDAVKPKARQLTQREKRLRWRQQHHSKKQRQMNQMLAQAMHSKS